MAAPGSKIKDINSLKHFSPLDELEPERLAELAESAQLHKLRKGQSVSAITEKNQTLYLLAGEVIRAPVSANAERIKAGTRRARQPLVSPTDRNRVVAESNVTVLSVDTDLLDLLRNWGNSNGLVVDEIDAGESGDWVDTLMQSGVVLSLSPTSIQALMAAIEPVEYPAGKVIFQQGDVPDYFYIVSRGECRVSRRSEGGEKELAILEIGDSFGEEALIANTTRNATVTMLKSGTLLRLDRNNFKNLLEQHLVHVINLDRAERLKAKGATVLDVRPAREFDRDGKGINIPLSELRDQIDTLARDKHYLVISDDNRASAIAAFLLGQKQVKSWVMQTETREEVAAKAAHASTQARELKSIKDELQQQLESTQQKLAAEQQHHASSRTRIQSLENDLRDAQKARIQSDQTTVTQQVFEEQRKIQAALLKSEEARQSLEQLSSRQAKDLESMQQRLAEIEARRHDLQQQIESLHQQSAQQQQQFQSERGTLERSLEHGKQAIQQTRHEIQRLERERNELMLRLEAQESEARFQAEIAQHTLETLNEQINSLKSTAEERHNRFAQAETEYQQRQSQLERRLRKSHAEKERMEEALSKEKLRNKIISEETARLRTENRRSSQVVNLLVLLILVIIGAAYYFEIDVQEQVDMLINKTAPHIESLIEKVRTLNVWK